MRWWRCERRKRWSEMSSESISPPLAPPAAAVTTQKRRGACRAQAVARLHQLGARARAGRARTAERIRPQNACAPGPVYPHSGSNPGLTAALLSCILCSSPCVERHRGHDPCSDPQAAPDKGVALAARIRAALLAAAGRKRSQRRQGYGCALLRRDHARAARAVRTLLPSICAHCSELN